MFNLLRERMLQKRAYIKDLHRATVPEPFRGFPVLRPASEEKWRQCAAVCPTGAIQTSPPRIDLGQCVFCGACERAFPELVHFSAEHRMSADRREKLTVQTNLAWEDFERDAIPVRKEIHDFFGSSLKLRSVSAGGCAACELELAACFNVNFDLGRFGIEIVASPRHADGLILTGPVTANMARALEDTYKSVPRPKILIAMGSCAIGGGLFSSSAALRREFLDSVVPDLYVPGCPAHPLTLIHGILAFIRSG